MDLATFQRIVTAFADSPADVDQKKGTLIAQVRDELIEVRLRKNPDGELQVQDGEVTYSAKRWISERLARLPTLARRILEYVPEDAHRVTVSAAIADVLENAPSEELRPSLDALAELQSMLATAGTFETNVIYITSDAGEGKTHLLNAISRAQARAYLEKKSDWLLLPVPLGGRPFIRLDDVIIGSLSNRLRFPFYYFESAIELARLGLIVLALDGFEEMFVENAAGDAISSLGSLVARMHSEGRLLIAARTAYFRYKSLDTQAKLFQSLASGEVSFAEVQLHRWSREQFLSLSAGLGLEDGAKLYQMVADKLGGDHPLLTRAVLARRLIEEYKEAPDRQQLVSKLTSAKGEDFFEAFISAMLDREVETKWIDRSGESAKPLLTRDEHHTLLSFIAEEMWRSGVSALSAGLLEVICDMVLADLLKKPAIIHKQARDRIKQHALLTDADAPSVQFSFDHEDFRNFYLGRRIGDLLAEGRLEDLRSLLALAALPALCVRVSIARALSRGQEAGKLVESLCSLARSETAVSYGRQNCAAMVTSTLKEVQAGVPISLHSLYFPVGGLKDLDLSGVTIEDCIFLRTAVGAARWNQVQFRKCSIERLEVATDWRADQVSFDEASLPQALLIGSGNGDDDEEMHFSPDHVRRELAGHGIAVAGQLALEAAERVEDEPELVIAWRGLKAFRRATALNEFTLRARLGVNAQLFFDSVLPRLLRAGVVSEVAYHGSGVQRRFRIGRDFGGIDRARAEANGSLDRFLAQLDAGSE